MITIGRAPDILGLRRTSCACQVWALHKDGFSTPSPGPSELLSNALLQLTKASAMYREHVLGEARKLLSVQDGTDGEPGSDARQQATTLLHAIKESLKEMQK